MIHELTPGCLYFLPLITTLAHIFKTRLLNFYEFLQNKMLKHLKSIWRNWSGSYAPSLNLFLSFVIFSCYAFIASSIHLCNKIVLYVRIFSKYLVLFTNVECYYSLLLSLKFVSIKLEKTIWCMLNKNMEDCQGMKSTIFPQNSRTRFLVQERVR